MDLEGVVHVLRKVHRALRPRGVALEIHPLPVAPWVEVWRDGRRTRLGFLDYSTAIAAISSARSDLASVQREGLFRPRGRRYFDWRAHYPTVDDWLRRREEYGSSIAIPPGLLRRARRKMRPPRTTLVIGERTRATAMIKTSR